MLIFIGGGSRVLHYHKQYRISSKVIRIPVFHWRDCMAAISKAQRHFQKRVVGKNFVTDRPDSFGWLIKNKISYELSHSGTPIFNRVIWGVTASRFSSTLSKSWTSKEEALLYIRTIEAMLNRRQGGNRT